MEMRIKLIQRLNEAKKRGLQFQGLFFSHEETQLQLFHHILQLRYCTGDTNNGAAIDTLSKNLFKI